MAAIGEPLEPYQMRRQGGSDVGLTFDGQHGIVLAAEHQSWTLDAMQIRKEVEVVAFAAGPREPLQHLRPIDRAPCHIRIARDARVMRHGEPYPGGNRGLIRLSLLFQKAPPRQRADLWSAETLE